MRRRLDASLLVAACALQLGLVASVQYFPSQDGPAHLEAAHLLRRLWSDDPGPVAVWFEVNARPSPNWVVQLALAGLMGFVPPLLAERLVIVVYLVGFAAAAWFTLGRMGTDARALALLALPLALSNPFHLGFFNFALAMVLAVFAVGLWSRERVSSVGFAALLLLVYACHLVAFGAIALALLAIEASRWLAGRRSPRRLWTLVAALGPGAALGLAFLFRGESLEDRLVVFRAAETLVGELLKLRLLESFVPPERWLGVAFLALLVGWTVVRLGRGARAGDPALRRGLGIAALGSVLLYFALPAGFGGGGGVNVRLLLAAALFALLWLGAGGLGRGERVLARVAGAGLVVAQVAFLWPSYQRADRATRDFVRMAPSLAPGSTLLSVVVTDGIKLHGRVRPLVHAVAHLAVERDVVNLSNYQAALDYFPIRYRVGRDPYLIWPESREPRTGRPRFDLAPFRRAGIEIDAVAVGWDARRGPMQLAGFGRSLGPGYRLLYRSRGAALFGRAASAAATSR